MAHNIEERNGVASFADKVAKVAVIIPDDSNSWNLLYGKYSSLKEMLTQKYGEPTSDKEEWQGYGGKPRDDNSCMHELRMNRANIGSYFETPVGDIELLILSIKMQCCVMLTYYDAVNYKAAVNSAMEDLEFGDYFGTFLMNEFDRGSCSNHL